MDHLWAANQLRVFVTKIDQLERVHGGTLGERVENSDKIHALADELLSLDPVMRDIMNAARPGYGEYPSPLDASADHYSDTYWSTAVKPMALRAMGVHELGAEARERLRPDSPDLIADQFHAWVWEAAAPLWHAGSRQEAVHAAARSVNARLQQKLGRHDQADAKLCREAFSLNAPAPGQPRLRFAGNRNSETWLSRQNGGIQLGAGCFEGIRNPAAHEEGLVLTEQVALEQLAAFSLLARWIDECEVEKAE
jgi:Protein of unknown function (Hypoth_ymh)